MPEQNEVVSRGGKQRTSIPVVEEVSEERLPLNTRFPPRNAANSNNVNSNVTPTAVSEETTKKISVKRPSELKSFCKVFENKIKIIFQFSRYRFSG